MLAAWWAGWIAGVTTTVLSMVALAWFFITARRDALDLVIFCGVSLLLTHFITRTNRALVSAHEALREAEIATAAKETVLAVVAHDVRNPLQTIGLGTELLRVSERTSTRPLVRGRAERRRVVRGAAS